MAIAIPKLTVSLPSNGVGYAEEDNIPKELNLTMLSVADTKIMLNGGKDMAGTIMKILANCVVEPINIKKLFWADITYLFFMLRAHSLGSDYKVDYKCRECDGKISSVKLIPDDFAVRELDSEEDIIVELVLPVTQYAVKLSLLKGEDEESLFKKSTKEFNDRIADRLAFHIKEMVDPCPKTEDEAVIVAYPVKNRICRTLPLKDMNVINKALSNIEFGFQTVSVEDCPHCGEQNEVVLAVNQNFFLNE